MAESAKKYNLHELEAENFAAVSQAILTSDPKKIKAEGEQTARDVIRGVWADAAMEVSSKRLSGPVMFSLEAMGACVLLAAIHSWPLLAAGVVAAGFGVRSSFINAGKARDLGLGYQLNPTDDYKTDANAAGDKAVYDKAAEKISTYIQKKTFSAPQPA